MSSISPLNIALKRCRSGFLAVALFSFFINILMLAAPLYMLQVFDRVLSSRSTDTLLYLTIIASVAFLTLAILEFVRSDILLRISIWLDRQLSPKILTEAVTAAVAGKQGANIQGLNDLANVRNFMTGAAIFPILDSPWTPVFLAVIFMLHPLLGTLALAGVIILLALALVTEWAIKKSTDLSNSQSVKARNWAQAAVRNADVVEAMAMMPAVLQRWVGANDEALHLQALASNRASMIKSVIKFVRMFLQIAMLGLGAWLTLKNELTPGGMIAGTILAGRALAPVDQAVGSWRTAVLARAAYGRLKQILSTATERGTGMPLPAPKGQIRVEAMSFLHDNTTTPALQRVDFALKPGECLCIVGPTSAGKTTLTRLLAGNLRPQIGHVRLDGMDMAQWEPDDRGKYVGYLPQAVELFDGTIQENIARMSEADADIVVKAAKFVGVHDLILQLPKGYDTEAGPDGGSLSAGMRQRIGLARALYSQPRLVVLDEPNSNLDPQGEKALVDTLVGLKKSKVTTIVATHRPSVLKYTDKILVLRAGKQEMFGPRDKVLKTLFNQTGQPAQAKTKET